MSKLRQDNLLLFPVVIFHSRHSVKEKGVHIVPLECSKRIVYPEIFAFSHSSGVNKVILRPLSVSFYVTEQ